MAELLTVARPYAEAIFRTAVEEGKLSDYSRMLAMTAAVASDSQMADTLANPRHSLATKLDLFNAIAGNQLNLATKNLVAILVESRRTVLLAPIAEHFEALKREHESTLKAVITSALPLTDADVQGVVQAIASKRGKKVEAVVNVDASLIGGVRIQIGDEVVSASVRDQLDHMAVALSQ